MNGINIEEKGQPAASSPVLLPALLILCVLLLVIGFFIISQMGTERVLIITDQNTNREYFSIPVSVSDVLTYGWIHSLEGIPWTEEYEILDNNKLLLRKITITGFGAGIPHNRGKVTKVENGIIIMDEIDEEFEEISWIHSRSAADYLMLNGRIILNGKDLPHHVPLRLKIEKRLKIWPR